MRPSMFMGGAGVKPATYVGTRFQYLETGAASLLISAIPGIQVGDYVFISVTGNSGYAALSGSGWAVDNYTWTTYGYRSSVFHKRLTSLDAATLSGTTFATVMMVAYRGASRASRKAVLTSQASTLTLPGFTRLSDCVGVVSHLVDRQTEGSPDLTPPAEWTRRAIQTLGFFRPAAADALDRAGYVDGEGVTWTDLGISLARVGMLYEMRL